MRKNLLEYVRELVTDYAVRQILHNGIAEELSPLTRFYLLWRWTYGEAKKNHFTELHRQYQRPCQTKAERRNSLTDF